MNFTQIGDLAQSLVMRRQNTLLKGQLNNLTQELASGRKSDVGQSLSGDFALLGEFESFGLLSGARHYRIKAPCQL